jgi:UMP-CMP kinase
MLHYSLGDNLRTWMRGNRDTPLAAQIQDRLDNQGFLNAEELSPFLHGAIVDAIRDNNTGVIVDGFPRCVEQLRSFDEWVTQDKLPIPQRGQTKVVARPDIVLLFEVTESNARSRYLGRGRDSNDSREKFERRFAEYQQETSLVEDEYQQRGVLLRVRVKSSSCTTGC